MENSRIVTKYPRKKCKGEKLIFLEMNRMRCRFCVKHGRFDLHLSMLVKVIKNEIQMVLRVNQHF